MAWLLKKTPHPGIKDKMVGAITVDRVPFCEYIGTEDEVDKWAVNWRAGYPELQLADNVPNKKVGA